MALSVKDQLNKDFYNGKLLELKDIDKIELDYKREKADTKRKKAEIMKDLVDTIPSLYTREQLLGDTYKTFETVMDLDPDFFTYAFIYGMPVVYPPYLMGGIPMNTAFMYIGKGNLARIISHGIILKKELTIPTTRLKEYNGDFRQEGVEPLLFIIGKGLDETRAKWVEADFIRFAQVMSHYTRGAEGLRMAPPLLNARRETAHEGRILGIDGKFLHGSVGSIDTITVVPPTPLPVIKSIG